MEKYANLQYEVDDKSEQEDDNEEDEEEEEEEENDVNDLDIDLDLHDDKQRVHSSDSEVDDYKKRHFKPKPLSPSHTYPNPNLDLGEYDRT